VRVQKCSADKTKGQKTCHVHAPASSTPFNATRMSFFDTFASAEVRAEARSASTSAFSAAVALSR
jgi:hypothetical protein